MSRQIAVPGRPFIGQINGAFIATAVELYHPGTANLISVGADDLVHVQRMTIGHNSATPQTVTVWIGGGSSPSSDSQLVLRTEIAPDRSRPFVVAFWPSAAAAGKGGNIMVATTGAFTTYATFRGFIL